MSWRVVMVPSNAKVDYKLDYLAVRTLEEVRRIHLREMEAFTFGAKPEKDFAWRGCIAAG